MNTQEIRGQSFQSLHDAYNWVVQELVNKHKVPLAASQIWHDLFRKPRSPMLQVIGMAPQAERIAQSVAPGGKWTLAVTQRTGERSQLQAWYSNYALYAYTMCQAEEGFRCWGIDFESINILFGTCRGYLSLSDSPAIDPQDRELLIRICHKSFELWPPTLPFDESFRPAAVFLALKNPARYAKQFMNSRSGYCSYHPHARAVISALGIPMPARIDREVHREKTPESCAAQ